jgi:hypothetical protein
MGFIASLLGVAPQQASIQSPVTANQATGQYNQANSAVQQQQDFTHAVMGQNGLNNQANVYNQLSGIASGTGANPAQAMLSQSTGQNVAQTQALMAGQRGASQNAGLIARQAAQQGANLQQQAVGQGASLQAQQSLNALGQMGSLANTQVGQQQQALGQLQASTQGLYGQTLGGIANQNNANVASQSSVNQSNASMFGGLANMVGGIGQGLLAAPIPKAHGGMIEAPSNHVLDYFSAGGQPAGVVPGMANVQGDSRKNDVVPAMLSPGEIVVPRSAAVDPNKAAAFAKAVAMRKGLR